MKIIEIFLILKTLKEISEFYVRRFNAFSPFILPRPDKNLKLAIVIPCYNEPFIIPTIESLYKCINYKIKIEIIIVFNSPRYVDNSIKENNLLRAKEIEFFNQKTQNTLISIHSIIVHDLDDKHSGVGWARKIGMDEALLRFSEIGFNGSIICLDSDCTVSENYLEALEKEFVFGTPEACSICFEHILNDQTNKELLEGIINYELFLRYYVAGLRFSGYPFSYHTIGSAMGVKAKTYALSGGMNRRKAGEDFYFLHKIIPRGNFININSAYVFPDSRISDRVPFGTGRAQKEWIQRGGGEFKSYSPSVFNDLRNFIKFIPQYFMEELNPNLPPPLEKFLDGQNFGLKIIEIRKNSKTLQSFLKRFYEWFDGFMVLKSVHFLRDRYYPDVPIMEAAKALLKIERKNKVEYLEIFRQLDRNQ